MKKIILKLLTILLLSTLLQAQQECEFPPQFGVKNFSFETHGYTPPEYALKDDTFGLTHLDEFGNDATKNVIESSYFPFEALNIIAGCGNSDVMYGASLVYEDKEVKKYWLKRAMKLNNIKAISTYYFRIEKDEEKYNKKVAKALYNIYINKKNNKLLRDMALSKLVFYDKYKEVINTKLPKYNGNYVSLSNRAIAEGDWKYYFQSYKVDTPKDTLKFLQKYSKKDIPRASLFLAEYYSWRDYSKTLKYLDKYKQDKFKISKELYPSQYKFTSKKNKVAARMLLKGQTIENIWKNLDEYQLKYSDKYLLKEIKSTNKNLKIIQQLHSFYVKESQILFDTDISELHKLTKDEKLKLLYTKATNPKKNDEKLIYDVINYVEGWQKNKKAIMKIKKKRAIEMKEMYNNLSNRSKNVMIQIAKELIKNNPKSYVVNNRKKEVMAKVHLLVLKLLRSMISLENSEYYNPIIVKKINNFNKKEYRISSTENINLLARKIDTLTFSNANSYQSYLKNSRLSAENEFDLLKRNKPKLKKAILYWLNYIVKNKDSIKKRETEIVINVYYRLAMAYNKQQSAYNLDTLEDKEKKYYFLNEIAKLDPGEKPFSKYYAGYSKKDILQKALKYSKKYNTHISKYINTEDLPKKFLSNNDGDELSNLLLSIRKDLIDNPPISGNNTSIDNYMLYFSSIAQCKEDFISFKSKAKKLNNFSILSNNIEVNKIDALFFELIIPTFKYSKFNSKLDTLYQIYLPFNSAANRCSLKFKNPLKKEKIKVK